MDFDGGTAQEVSNSGWEKANRATASSKRQPGKKNTEKKRHRQHRGNKAFFSSRTVGGKTHPARAAAQKHA